MSKETKDQVAEDTISEEQKPEEVRPDFEVKGQYEQSIYLASRKIKLDVSSFKIKRNGEDELLFTVSILTPEGEKVKMALSQDDIGDLADVISSAKYIFI